MKNTLLVVLVSWLTSEPLLAKNHDQCELSLQSKKEIEFKINNKPVYLRDDLLIAPNESEKNDVKLWDVSRDGKVYIGYELDKYWDTKAEDVVEGMRRWNFATRGIINFVKRTSANASHYADYISFENQRNLRQIGTCSSYLGKKGGKQEIISSFGGCELKLLVHEIGHALGLVHEHQRPDRDKYIKILWCNIMGAGGIVAALGLDYRWAFLKHETTIKKQNYDFNSIMHYGKFSFSRIPRFLPTLQSLDPDREVGNTLVGYPSRGDGVALLCAYLGICEDN